MAEHRTYLWGNPMEWFERNGDRDVLLDWLFENGHVDFDMIQACFQSEMNDDGYFVGWPTDEDWPLRQDTDSPEGGYCTHCEDEFDERDRKDLETGKYALKCVPCNGTEDEEECPVRKWITSGKRVKP